MTLREAILMSAEAAVEQQRPDGSFAPGHNGPWRQAETPARVTAHWSILLAYADLLTGDARYRAAALGAGEWLAGDACRPHGFAFHLRHEGGRGNGLIGQAWVLEALVVLGARFRRDDWLAIAEDVVEQHAFDSRLGLWYALDIDGTRLRLSRVMNQQVWFGATVSALARLRRHRLLSERARRFGECLSLHLTWRHPEASHLTWALTAARAIDVPAAAVARRLAPVLFRRANLRELSIGYLSFLLYGLALLRETDTCLPLWQDPSLQSDLQRSAACLRREVFTIRAHDYAWSYNPTGLEMAYVAAVFGVGDTTTSAEWVGEQLRRHLNPGTGLLDRHTGDPATLAARIYEAVRVDARMAGLSGEAADVFRLVFP